MEFLYPVPAAAIITQTFAEHVQAARVNHWSNYNGGIDYAVPVGTPVEGSQAGVVTVARNDATGYGTHVRIQHADGYMTIYGHLSHLLVGVGEQVEAGDVIGLSGNTGNSTGPHLHFELRKDGRAIDPQPLLRAALVTEPGPKPQPVEPIIGRPIVLEAGWNMRAGPGTNYQDLGTTDAPLAVDVRDVQDGYMRVTIDVWVDLQAARKGGL